MPISAKDSDDKVGVSVGHWVKLTLPRAGSGHNLSETRPNFEAFLGSPGLKLDSNSSHFLIGYPLLTHLPASNPLSTPSLTLLVDLILLRDHLHHVFHPELPTSAALQLPLPFRFFLSTPNVIKSLQPENRQRKKSFPYPGFPLRCWSNRVLLSRLPHFLELLVSASSPPCMYPLQSGFCPPPLLSMDTH